MVATSAAPNRIAPYLSEPQKLVIPATREGREAVLTDAVFAAITALQGLLTHADPKVVMRAAEMILNLETTRQRHGRVLIGMEMCEDPLPVFAATVAPDPHPPAPSPHRGGGERTVNHANPLDMFIEKVRAELQSQEDAEGTGVIVSRAQAEECARHIQANMDQAPAGRRCHEVKDRGPPGRGGHEMPDRRERAVAPRQTLAPR